MTDFGRVGHIRSPLGTDATFMVIGESDNEHVRQQVPDFRLVINLSGVGNQGGTLIRPGEIGAVHMDDTQIEWLDD